MTPPEGRCGVRLKAVSVTPYGPSQSGRGHSKTLREDPEQVLECPLPLLYRCCCPTILIAPVVAMQIDSFGPVEQGGKYENSDRCRSRPGLPYRAKMGRIG